MSPPALLADLHRGCRRLKPLRPALILAAALGCVAAFGPAAGAHQPARHRHRDPVEIVKTFVRAHPHSVELVTFGKRAAAPVRVVRGGGWRSEKAAMRPPPPQQTTELVSFPDPGSPAVRVVRGPSAGGPATTVMVRPQAIERVTFSDPHYQPVTVIRGPTFASAAVLSAAFEPFGPASAADLDRVAFAVDGAESSHGANPAMWRTGFSGPQGPMQVSLAAALDVGGGDRFDLDQNRMLGRAYLAQMFRRYGNWPDAIAAYNWGPGNVDAWIANGRPAGALPLETERYLERVLRDAGLSGSLWVRTLPLGP